MVARPEVLEGEGEEGGVEGGGGRGVGEGDREEATRDALVGLVEMEGRE